MNNNETRFSIKKTGFILSSLSLAVSGVLAAQVAQAAEGARSLDEIVVTARRRDESLQNVPVAVSAFGAEQIKERGITTESDMQMNTPGLVVRATNSSNQLNFALRGQTVDAFSYAAPAVLAYINEVQAGGVTASSFFDLESVQVLKGPQGTLFGRNATGGAVLYATKKPEHEFGGYAKVGMGNYSDRLFEGAVNVPLTEDLAVRVAGMTEDRDGWQKNVYDGADLAEIDTENLRISVLYETDNFENTFVGYYAEHGGNAEGLKIRNAYNFGDTNNGVGLNANATSFYPDGLLDGGFDYSVFGSIFPLNPGFVDSNYVAQYNPRLVELANEMGFDGLQSFIAAQNSGDFYDVYNDVTSNINIRHQHFANTTVYTVSDALVIKNIMGYNDVQSLQPVDIDGSPFMLLRQGSIFDPDGYIWNQEQFSNEFQISGEVMGGALNYIVGVFYSSENNENRIPLNVNAEIFQDLYQIAYHAAGSGESKAIFAQGTYALTDRMNLTVGYRHTWEETTLEQHEDSVFTAFYGTQPAKLKVDRPSWLVSLDYALNDETMVYLSHRGSWRTGGFNATSTEIGNNLQPDGFGPEKTWDVEAGIKFAGYIGEIPTRINLAVYEQIVEDAQRTVYLVQPQGPVSLTGNVGEATATGLELDAMFSFTDWLDVGFGYAHTNARFTEPFGDVAGYPYAFGPYADSPKDTFTAYFATEHYLDGLGVLNFRGDFYHTTGTYFSNLNDSIGPGTEIEGYDLANFRLALSEIGGSTVSAAAYVRNAFDEEYERGGLPLAGSIGTNGTIAGEPRTFGAEVTYSF